MRQIFSELFAFEAPAIVDFVGGGGKTSLILRLLEEYSSSSRIVYTTTTRMHPPHPTSGMVVLSGDDEAELHVILDRVGREFGHALPMLVVAGPEMAPGLLQGVSPGFAGELDPALFPLVLNEADGARSVSLKLTRENEPVPMRGAGCLVPVIGLDCIHQRVGPESVFRWDLADGPLARMAGRTITPGIAASILLSPQGVCKCWSSGQRIIVFINKVDGEAQDPLARQLAQAILQADTFPVEAVVWGSLKNPRGRLLRRQGG